jgi:hypothetical protein
MFKGNQLEQVRKAKEKALKVFTDTKEKFQAAIEEAQEIRNKNRDKVHTKHYEISELEEINDLLGQEISAMQKSVEQINSIVGA